MTKDRASVFTKNKNTSPECAILICVASSVYHKEIEKARKKSGGMPDRFNDIPCYARYDIFSDANMI